MATYANNYIPYYPPNKYNLDNTLLRDKYKRIMEDKSYFNNVKIINFDIIHHISRQDPLQRSIKHYETIYKENLKRAKEKDINYLVREAIKSKRSDLCIKKNVLSEHFKNEQKLIEFKLKNKALFSSMHKRKEIINQKYAECW